MTLVCAAGKCDGCFRYTALLLEDAEGHYFCSMPCAESVDATPPFQVAEKVAVLTPRCPVCDSFGKTCCKAHKQAVIR